MPRKRKALPKEPVVAHIEDLTHEGKGVAKIDGKTVFISATLPGEDVEFVYSSKHRKYDEGVLHKLLQPSEKRIQAKCSHFDICGGCSFQHLSTSDQIQFKQKILIDNLQRIGHVQAQHIIEPMTGPQWGYRRKARLGAKYVDKKEKMLVGFREKQSRYLADLSRCEVLHPSVGERLTELADLILSLSCYRAIPQIEIAAGANTTALVFRHLEPLTGDDERKLIDFGKQYHFDIYLQSKGPDTITLLWPETAELYYELQDHNVRLDFLPSDFVQVNDEINRKIVNMVIEKLGCSESDHILELFCGLGNFSLPLAQKLASVTAVEGDKSLIDRARQNASRNNITNVNFHVANLMEDVSHMIWWKEQSYAGVFLDPPRSGAEQVLPLIAKLRIPKIVYVSCNPATLARDAGILVNDYGYTLNETGVMDMFPHTAHVESFAVFTRGK